MKPTILSVSCAPGRLTGFKVMGFKVMGFKVIVTFLFTLLFTAPVHAAPVCQEQVINGLEKVGDTRLRVYLFSVYDAALYTPDGDYPSTEKVLAISYLRSIKAEQLVKTTGDEWAKLGYNVSDREQQWLTYLEDIWPDVERGDCLLASLNSDGETTFYNRDGKLGKISEQTFGDRFFAIWLSENSSFRRNRDELTGARP